MRLIRWTLAISGLLLICCLFSARPARAADTSFSFTASPLPVHLVTEPGKTISTDLRVKNNGPKTERIKVGLMKFGATRETGQPTLESRTAKDTHFDWVRFSQTVFTAPPNEWVTIKMTIDVPPTAAFGYYYAVTFSRAESPTTNKNTTTVVGSTASLVMLEVTSPNSRRDVDLVDFTSKHRAYEFLPTSFDIKLRNPGNIHITPVGNIFISRGGKQVATLAVNGAGGTILPETNRIFKAAWSEGFPVYQDKIVDDKPIYGTNGEPERALKWNFSDIEKLRFGKYSAHLLVVYNDGQKDIPLEAELTFWVIPWRILTGLFLVLLLTGVGAWFILRGTWHQIHPHSTHRTIKHKSSKTDE